PMMMIDSVTASRSFWRFDSERRSRTTQKRASGHAHTAGCSYLVLPASGAGITEVGRSFDGDRDACRGGQARASPYTQPAHRTVAPGTPMVQQLLHTRVPCAPSRTQRPSVLKMS